MNLPEGWEIKVTVGDDAKPGERQCGSCTLCCRLVPVQSLDKKAGVRCKHQRTSCGCNIYQTKPPECGYWSCQWLVNPAARNLRRPDRSHYVVDIMPDTVIARLHDTGEEIVNPVMQVWIDPLHPESHHDPALRAYIEHVAKTEGMATLLRWNNERGVLVLAPCLTADGEWWEQESIRRDGAGLHGNRRAKELT